MSETSDRRPSWLDEACPAWCAREHHEDDHPEDRQHRSRGIEVAGVVADRDRVTMRQVARGTELVVQRSQHLGGAESWVAISDAEARDPSLEVSAETAERLGSVLLDQATRVRP